jgi:hypothetical protein
VLEDDGIRTVEPPSSPRPPPVPEADEGGTRVTGSGGEAPLPGDDTDVLGRGDAAVAVGPGGATVPSRSATTERDPGRRESGHEAPHQRPDAPLGDDTDAVTELVDPPPGRSPTAVPPATGRRRFGTKRIWLPGGLAALVLGTVIALTSGGGDRDTSATPTPTRAPTRAEPTAIPGSTTESTRTAAYERRLTQLVPGPIVSSCQATDPPERRRSFQASLLCSSGDVLLVYSIATNVRDLARGLRDETSVFVDDGDSEASDCTRATPGSYFKGRWSARAGGPTSGEYFCGFLDTADDLIEIAWTDRSRRVLGSASNDESSIAEVHRAWLAGRQLR